MDISVVIPAYNERESLTELYNWIKRVMQEMGSPTKSFLWMMEAATVHGKSSKHSARNPTV